MTFPYYPRRLPKITPELNRKKTELQKQKDEAIHNKQTAFTIAQPGDNLLFSIKAAVTIDGVRRVLNLVPADVNPINRRIEAAENGIRECDTLP